jgi:TetR/AcrR family transcriptional regulator, regulator of biofilm formation and stress response
VSLPATAATMADVSEQAEPLSVDGRLARGARRRAEIIEATIRVVEQEGIAGVSHRRIATTLKVSPSALTYHFPTLDDLLEASLIEALLWTDAGLAEVSSIDELTDHLWGQMTAGRRRLAAVYELYLLAARRPALLPAARGWVASLRDLARRLGADPAGEAALVVAIDGIGLLALLSHEEVDRTEVRVILARAVGGVA